MTYGLGEVYYFSLYVALLLCYTPYCATMILFCIAAPFSIHYCARCTYGSALQCYAADTVLCHTAPLQRNHMTSTQSYDCTASMIAYTVYATLCCAMLCCTTPSYTSLCYTTPQAMLYSAILCYAIPIVWDEHIALPLISRV
jgi:hypothetical protein